MGYLSFGSRLERTKSMLTVMPKDAQPTSALQRQAAASSHSDKSELGIIFEASSLGALHFQEF